MNFFVIIGAGLFLAFSAYIIVWAFCVLLEFVFRVELIPEDEFLKKKISNSLK